MNDKPQQEAEVIDLEERRRLRQATGSGGPTGGGKDWLTELENGTRFLAKELGRGGSELDDFIVTTPPKSLAAVLLLKNVKGKDGIFEWHDPVLFSKMYRLFATLEVIDNGSDKSVQPERLASHEDAEKQSGVHEVE